MLKLVSNKKGVEIHQLEINQNDISIYPDFPGVIELVREYQDKQSILNALSQFHPDYVWAVTYETPSQPPLTRRQFRLVLVKNGYNLQNIEALIHQIEDEQEKQIILIEWQDATTFERNSVNLLKVANLMQMSGETIDLLWRQALTL